MKSFSAAISKSIPVHCSGPPADFLAFDPRATQVRRLKIDRVGTPQSGLTLGAVATGQRVIPLSLTARFRSGSEVGICRQRRGVRSLLKRDSKECIPVATSGFGDLVAGSRG
jgi:hypothetical protein